MQTKTKLIFSSRSDLDGNGAPTHIPLMNNAIPEIRYDHMTDRALLDPESTVALHTLSARWHAKASQRPQVASAVHPLTQSARRRQDALQRAWRAMAGIRTNLPFPLIRRADGSSRSAITPHACINVYGAAAN